MKKFKKIYTFLTAEHIILFSFIILYIIYFTYFTFERHMNFFTGRYDLGNMDQTVWNTLHGNIFTFTNPDFNMVMSRLSVHSDFLLILLTPFYIIWEDARMLLLIQTVVIAAGAYFVYAIAKKIIKNPAIALLLSMSYLLNPFVQEQNIFDFHAVSLATTFLLGAWYYLIKNNYKVFFLYALLAVLTKEHIFVVVGLLHLYIFFFRRKVWALGISIICFILFYLLVAKLIPGARFGTHFALSYYNEFGNSPSQILTTFFTHPLKVFFDLVHNGIGTYSKYLFLPVGFLSFFSPAAFIFALPEFFINMLSSKSALRTYDYHYAAAILPFIYISAIYGIQKICSWIKKPDIQVVIAVYIFCMVLFSSWYFGPLPWSKNPDSSAFKKIPEKASIYHYLDTLSPTVAIAATNNLGAHLSHREKLYTIPTGIEKSDMVMFLTGPLNSRSQQENQPIIDKLIQTNQFVVAYRVGNFIALKRIK